MAGDIEEIKSKLNIVDVLRDYIRLEKAGANHRALCPFHNEKSPSFMVSDEKQMWHCFGCQKGGDMISFVMEIEGLDFRSALQLLADKAGVELRKTDPKLAAQKSKTLEILELATKFYEAQLWGKPGEKKILPYLVGRGLKNEIIKQFRLGYAPDGWRNIIQFLEKRGYTVAEIAKTGLLVEKKEGQNSKYYDRFRDRIMFPIADTNGKVVGYSARVAPGGDESQAKYVNTPETEVYHKSSILYGIDKAKTHIRENDWALLVEGNTDVIACAQAGIGNVMAVSGTALTDEHLAIIRRYTGNIKLLFDMDKAGRAATKKSLKACFAKDMKAQVVTLPEGKDAAELAQKDPDALKKAVAEALPAMEYFFQQVFSQNDKNQVEGKRRITDELLEMISAVENPVERDHWLKKLGNELDIETSVLTDMLKKAKLKERIELTAENPELPGKTFSRSSKLETLTQELLGLMFVSPAVWEQVVKNHQRQLRFAKDQLLAIAIQQGPDCGYDFDKLVGKIDDQQVVSAIEKIFFEKKYRLSINNQLEEVEIEDPTGDATRCLSQIARESGKAELQRICHDLDAAEKNGDREAAQFLRRQVKEITENL